jgi:3-oxoacyl-[acyl-carrier-protein] synthase II
MTKKRIVVTGLGTVSCFGNDPKEFYQKLCEGKSGIKPIDSFDCSDYPTRFAGVIPPFDTEGYMDKKQARRVDPFIKYIMVSGKKALEDAKVDISKLDLDRCGILVGSGMGGMTSFSDGVVTLKEKGFKRLTPFFVPYIITNMGGALLAIDLGFKGPNYSISTACATSNYCIVSAAEEIRKGNADLMLCGGAEAPITPIGLAGFVACKALSTNNDDPQGASRPWDTNRNGFVMGEGSGVLVLESLDHALKRGATIYGEYLGGAINCDAYHMTDPRSDGKVVADCIRLALEDAQLDKEKVNYVNAHATSTLAGDLCEIAALRDVFKDHVGKIKINATKSMIGHCLGAAGGLEAVATIQAIHQGKIHPTINLKEPEEAVKDLDIVKDQAVSCKITGAISNSFGFGGHNSTVVFGPYNA